MRALLDPEISMKIQKPTKCLSNYRNIVTQSQGETETNDNYWFQ